MPVTNVPAPGSPIRSNWAISVSNVANSGEGAVTSKVAKAGDTMTGNLTVGPGAPSAGNIATRLTTAGEISAAKERSGAIDPIVALYRGTAQAGAAGDIYVRFLNGPGGAYTVAGGITLATATTVAYNTSSDHRLKTDVADLTGDPDTLTRFVALRPVAFRWQNDPAAGTFDGFLAHEVDPLIPGAVTGEVDAVDPETGAIEPQMIDHSKLVPLLTAALQTVLHQLDALTARVAALET